MQAVTEKYLRITQGIKMSQELARPPSFAYDRVSTLEQADGLSLEYQSQGAAKYARENDFHVVYYFTVAESASKEGRRVFNEMIDLALRFDVKHLIFKSTDRMSRNYRDLARIIELIEHHDFVIHFYQNNKTITKNSTHDEKFMIGIEQAVAKHLSDKISHDIKNVNAYKVKMGIYCGNAPYGYIYDKEHKKFVIDKNTEHSLRFVFDEFDTGKFSFATFRDFLNTNKIPAPKGGEWSKSSVSQVLKNPFYHGEFIHKSQLFKGNHETYYERERFEDRIKRIDGNCVTDKRFKVQAPLKKFIVCECGRLMTPDIKKKQYLYYVHKCPHCDMRQITVSEEDIFSKIDKEVERVSFSNELSALLKSLFGGAIIRHQKDRNKDVSVLSRRITNLEIKKNKLYDLYLEDDYFTRDDLKRKLVEIDKLIHSLKTHYKSLSFDKEKLQIEVNNVIDTFNKLPEMYESADHDKKARILKEMAECIVVNKEAVGIQWKKPYIFLMKEPILAMNKPSDKTPGTKLPDNDVALTGTTKRSHINKKDVLVSSKTSYPAPPVGLEPTTQWLTATCSTD